MREVLDKSLAVSWQDRFRTVFDQACQRFHGGAHSAQRLFQPEEISFLDTIGCSTQELFDFVEDHCYGGDPDYQSILEVTAIRERYFREVLHGHPVAGMMDPALLPAKSDALGGIRWLPRMIDKAEAKLHGTLHPDIMYGCGGDRAFVRSIGMTLAAFLTLAWEEEGRPGAVLEAVQACKAGSR